MALITVFLFRESIAECKLPETPEQDKSVFRIPVGGRVPVTSSTSMDDEDLADDIAGSDMMETTKSKKSKVKAADRKKSNAAGPDADRLSDSEDEDLDLLKKEQDKAEKHKKLFDVQPYQPISCLMSFNPLEVLPRSLYVARKLWRNEDSKYTSLRNMQNRNIIIFF